MNFTSQLFLVVRSIHSALTFGSLNWRHAIISTNCRTFDSTRNTDLKASFEMLSQKNKDSRFKFLKRWLLNALYKTSSFKAGQKFNEILVSLGDMNKWRSSSLETHPPKVQSHLIFSIYKGGIFRAGRGIREASGSRKVQHRNVTDWTSGQVKVIKKMSTSLMLSRKRFLSKDPNLVKNGTIPMRNEM